MSEENTGTKFKVIGCRVTEDELQNFITPIMHDCYQLGLIKHDTVSAFVRFCINFWIGHNRARKQEFEMRQQDIEQEKKKTCKDSWKTFVNPIVALYRVIVLSNDLYSNNPDDPYWIAAVAVQETCHTNQYWSLRFLWMSKWDKETECTLKHIDALKQIGAPQYFIDASQGRLDRHEKWWSSNT